MLSLSGKNIKVLDQSDGASDKDISKKEISDKASIFKENIRMSEKSDDLKEQTRSRKEQTFLSKNPQKKNDLDSNLAGDLDAPSTTGFITRISEGNYILSSLQAGSSNNITITSPDGTSGNPTIDFSNTITVNGITITNAPSAGTDAVNKSYVDTQIVGTVKSVTSNNTNNIVIGGTATAPTVDLALAGASGTYNNPNKIITDAYGRVTTVTTGLAPVTSVTGTSDILITGTANTPIIGLATTGVTAGTYYKPTLAVNSVGRITSISSMPSINEIIPVSGAWIIPTGVTAAAFTLIGGGGGGGSATAGNGAGSGGGAGALTYIYLTGLGQISQNSITITVGTGGATNTSGTVTSIVYTIGSNSYTISANGGSGGSFANNYTNGGSGGIKSTIPSGIIGYSITGNSGGVGYQIPTVAYITGSGGSTFLGGAGGSITTASLLPSPVAGLSASANSGSGGSGATITGAGSAGGSGLCIIEY